MNAQHPRDAFVLAAVQWAAATTEKNVQAKLKRGLNVLATVAATAPLVGLFGTVLGIERAFRGCGAPLWFCYTQTLYGLCQALVSTALGLLVAVPAVWTYNYFSDRLRIYELEVKSASLELITYVAKLLGENPLTD